MNILETINEAISYQCSHEMLNMWKYKVIASYFEEKRLPKLAKKFYDQADEEYGHYSKMVEYLNTRMGGKYIPVEVDKPNIVINSYKEVGKLYLQTELETTESLHSIAELIYEEKSYIDVDFIQEFLKIQITEENEADEFMKKIELVTDIVLFDATFS